MDDSENVANYGRFLFQTQKRPTLIIIVAIIIVVIIYVKIVFINLKKEDK